MRCHPCVRCVRTGQALLARRYVVEHVSAHIARRQAERTQTTEHQMGEILAHATSMLEHLAHLRSHGRRLRIVAELSLDAARQIEHRLEPRAPLDETHYLNL